MKHREVDDGDDTYRIAGAGVVDEEVVYGYFLGCVDSNLRLTVEGNPSSARQTCRPI